MARAIAAIRLDASRSSCRTSLLSATDACRCRWPQRLKAVVHSVIDLFDQQLLPIERVPQIFFDALPLDRHSEDVGDALQKYDIALREFAFRPAIDF